MRHAGRLLAVWLLIGPAAVAIAAPAGRWVGQDGHDLVGQFAKPGKSDIQDIRLAISGLPPRARIVATTVKADGGGEWKADGAERSWMALVVRGPGGASADVYIEPYQAETGRTFFVELTCEGGQVVTVPVAGGRADPNLRTASARMEARWAGQDRHDHATSSPNVGPDGIQDVHLVLKKLALKDKDDVKSIVVVGPGDLRWAYGPNPDAHPGAELVRDPGDPTAADLFFHPTRDLSNASLKIQLTYVSGKLDSASVTCGRCDPALKVVPAVVPPMTVAAVRSTWLGQGGPSTRPGDVRVRLHGLSISGRVVGASLGDGAVGWWADHRVEGLADALPLDFRRGVDPATAELAFPPVRDESRATMTLRLALADGRSTIVEFPGGPCDPSLRALAPEVSSVRAKPGDDLQALMGRHGTVTLAAGIYTLTKPLVLRRGVTITSEGGATLRFAQAAGEPPWTAAIKVQAGRTTLDRLAIRFAGPVRWDQTVSYGPAVIGTTDNRDTPTGAVLAGLAFTRLDIEGPPASTSWEESPKVLRLVGATNGRVEGNVFKGGMVELFGGPWRYVDNQHVGTPPGTFTHSVLSAHDLHDAAIVKNRAKPVEPCGKTWRWLVLTTRGEDVRVSDNVIEGVGPRDSDKVEHPNAPETILTESYRVFFEGKTAGVSPDGRVVAIPRPQGGAAGVGAVVSILSGPEAGTWRRVALPIGPNSYLLDRPVNLKGGAISIEPGFVGTAFENNTIDDRGSLVCVPFVLAGNHFGTRIAGNKTLGGVRAFQVVSASTESPVHWGWSHNPMLGLTIEGNTFAEDRDGPILGVEHNPHSRTTRGRVYMSATLTNNTFSRLDAATSPKGKGGGLEIGWKGAGDPGALIVVESGNRLVSGRSGPSARVFNATVNGKAIKEGVLTFPAVASPSARRDDARPMPR